MVLLTDDWGDEPAGEPMSAPPSNCEIDDAEHLLVALQALERKVAMNPAERTCGAEAGSEAALRQGALEFLALRRRRHGLFGRAMFGEPAWEILLLLYALGSKQTVTRLAELACASKTTAIRWIDYLEGQRLVAREDHPTDKRAVCVDLTDKARDLIRLYFSGAANKSVLNLR